MECKSDLSIPLPSQPQWLLYPNKMGLYDLNPRILNQKQVELLKQILLGVIQINDVALLILENLLWEGADLFDSLGIDPLKVDGGNEYARLQQLAYCPISPPKSSPITPSADFYIYCEQNSCYSFPVVCQFEFKSTDDPSQPIECQITYNGYKFPSCKGINPDDSKLQAFTQVNLLIAEKLKELKPPEEEPITPTTPAGT